MLPPDLLRLRPRGEGRAAPAWLSPRDDVWIRQVLAAADARVGHPAGRLEAELGDALDPLVALHGIDRRALRGVLHVVVKSFRRTVAAPIAPSEIRAKLFPIAADQRSAAAGTGRTFQAVRAECIEQTAAALSTTAPAIEHGLFADHPSQKLVVAREPMPPAEAVRDRYQLALLQGCLLRASQVRLWVTAQVRSVARYAKLERLLCAFELEDAATRIELSGPLALFHETLKYGRALAKFIPSVLSTPGWRLEADCLIHGKSVRVHADAAAPLPRLHALPRAEDSKLEAALARDLRRLRSDWTITREASAIHIGRGCIFPDFLLARGADRVLVEVVGFWTPEYLASKLAALRSVTGVPFVVAVDAERGWTPTSLPNAELVAFRRRIDAAEIIAAAERAARAHGDRRSTGNQ